MENICGEEFYFTDKQKVMHFLDHSLFGHQVMDARETLNAPLDRKEDA